MPGEQQGAEDYTDGPSRRLDEVGCEAFSARTRCTCGRATRGRRRRNSSASKSGHQQSCPRARVQVTRNLRIIIYSFFLFFLFSLLCPLPSSDVREDYAGCWRVSTGGKQEWRMCWEAKIWNFNYVFLLRGENVVFSIRDDSTRLEQVSSQTLYEDEGFEIIPTDSYHPVKYFGSSRISSESYTYPPLWPNSNRTAQDYARDFNHLRSL